MITESAAPVITLAGLSVRQRQATIISMGSPMIGADIWKLGKVANPMVSRAKAPALRRLEPPRKAEQRQPDG